MPKKEVFLLTPKVNTYYKTSYTSRQILQALYIENDI